MKPTRVEIVSAAKISEQAKGLAKKQAKEHVEKTWLTVKEAQRNRVIPRANVPVLNPKNEATQVPQSEQPASSSARTVPPPAQVRQLLELRFQGVRLVRTLSKYNPVWLAR